MTLHTVCRLYFSYVPSKFCIKCFVIKKKMLYVNKL